MYPPYIAHGATENNVRKNGLRTGAATLSARSIAYKVSPAQLQNS